MSGDGYVRKHRFFGLISLSWVAERENGCKMASPPEKIRDFDDILEHVGSWNRYEQGRLCAQANTENFGYSDTGYNDNPLQLHPKRILPLRY